MIKFVRAEPSYLPKMFKTTAMYLASASIASGMILKNENTHTKAYKEHEEEYYKMKEEREKAGL